MNKKRMLYFSTAVLFVVVILLWQACTTTPSAQIELGANYRKYLQQPSGNERAIDSIGLRGPTSFVCRDTSHALTSSQQLGVTYQIGGQFSLFASRNDTEAAEPPSERHRHEQILDQLLDEVKRQYLNETVDMRSARTARHIPTNSRLEEYQEYVRSGNSGYYVTRTRYVYDCFLYYTASIITTEPMPQPVTHSEQFTIQGMTRRDIQNRIYNWLERNRTSRRISDLRQDHDRGEITGTVTIAARTTDQSYFITSNFTIDVYDARTEIDFTEALVHRTDSSLQIVGSSEPIFLQSIANAAQAELVDFSINLRSHVLSQ